MKTMAGINNVGTYPKSQWQKKTIIQTLRENEVPPTRIAQLSGHKYGKSMSETAGRYRQNSRCKWP